MEETIPWRKKTARDKEEIEKEKLRENGGKWLFKTARQRDCVCVSERKRKCRLSERTKNNRAGIQCV